MFPIGILETGEPPPNLRARFGGYGEMFAGLLGPGFSVKRYDVRQGVYPNRAETHSGYIVTGSPAGVYDAEPWIAALKAWLAAAKGRARLVGICFGHQIMAEAFGGRVEKSARGWGVGLHRYEVIAPEPWMDAEGAFSIAVSHQDQVVRRPPAAEIVAGNAFSPFGMLAYRDQPAISFQCHPEFDPAFAKALIESRRDRLPDPDCALASLDGPDDRARLAGWIQTFLSAS